MPTDATIHTDRAIFAAIAQGDEKAFGEFFHRYNTKVYYFVLNMLEVNVLAEEVVQDVFLKLWLNRASLTDVGNPGSYLFVMAKNRALDQLDRLATERKFKEQMGVTMQTEAADSEEQVWYKESLALVTEAVNTLPDQQRRIFQLSKLEGLSREEIALQLQLSPHTVKNHLGAAVKSVQQYLLVKGKVVTILLFLHFLGRH